MTKLLRIDLIHYVLHKMYNVDYSNGHYDKGYVVISGTYPL
jgi:hypothetical protein